MGMLLFDKSGTFVPSDYGLSVGDVLHIVAIGGAAAQVQPEVQRHSVVC